MCQKVLALETLINTRVTFMYILWSILGFQHAPHHIHKSSFSSLMAPKSD